MKLDSKSKIESSINQDQKSTLKKIFNYVEENYTNDIQLTEIANLTNLNESYLCRFFKSSTDMTLFEYINQHRCLIARRKLENTNDSVTDIALSSGFSSTSYFSRVFKSQFTLSPSQYRKALPKW